MPSLRIIGALLGDLDANLREAVLGVPQPVPEGSGRSRPVLIARPVLVVVPLG